MKFGIVNNKTGAVISDPMPYNWQRFKNILQAWGGNAALLPEHPDGAMHCGFISVLPAVEKYTTPPAGHSYQARFTSWALLGDTIYRETEWHQLPDDLIVRQLKKGLADLRWKAEVGGVTLPDGNTHIKTDRESQAALSSAYSSLKDGLIPDTPWKAAEGWMDVTFSQLKPIAQAVAHHVRACFDAEHRVEQQIDNADTNTLLNFNLSAAFNAAMS